MLRPDYICPACHFVGSVVEVMIFQNNRITEIECAKCEAQIRYTVKSEVVE